MRGGEDWRKDLVFGHLGGASLSSLPWVEEAQVVSRLHLQAGIDASDIIQPWRFSSHHYIVELRTEIVNDFPLNEAHPVAHPANGKRQPSPDNS
jgi:hypothetical protein